MKKKYMDTDIIKKRERVALLILGFVTFLILVSTIFVMFLEKFSSDAIKWDIIIILISMILIYGIKRIITITPPEPQMFLQLKNMGFYQHGTGITRVVCGKTIRGFSHGVT